MGNYRRLVAAPHMRVILNDLLAKLCLLVSDGFSCKLSKHILHFWLLHHVSEVSDIGGRGHDHPFSIVFRGRLWFVLHRFLVVLTRDVHAVLIHVFLELEVFLFSLSLQSVLLFHLSSLTLFLGCLCNCSLSVSLNLCLLLVRELS